MEEIRKKALKAISFEITTLQMKLDNINLNKKYEQYKEDIFTMYNLGVNVLAKYFVDGGTDVQNKFNLIISVRATKVHDDIDIKEELKNIYYLAKKDLFDISQYKESVNKVNIFFKYLIDEDNNLEADSYEKNLVIRSKELKALKKYYMKDYELKHIKSIVEFDRLITSLDISNQDKIEMLEFVILNETRLYREKLNIIKNEGDEYDE